jgi:hypothetical protein
MEYDLDLPSEYKWSEELLAYVTFIRFFNIESDKIVIDYQKFSVDFVNFDNSHVIELSFPLIRDWQVATSYEHNVFFIFPNKGDVTFWITDISLSLAFSFNETRAGTIQPYAHNIELSLGDSKL